MKFIISTLLVLALMFSTTLSAVSFGFYNNPKYPGKCFFSEDVILSPGEHKHPQSECARINCHSDGSAETQTCGVQMLQEEGFKYGDYEDITLPYPDCCNRKIVPV